MDRAAENRRVGPDGSGDVATPSPAMSQGAGPRRVRMSARVAACLRMAEDAARARQWGEAVERIAAGAVEDIQHDQLTFLAGAFEAGLVGEKYGSCFAAALGDCRQVRRDVYPHARDASEPRRLLYITASLVPGQAASRRLLRMLELHDRDRFEPQVLVTEEFTARRPPLRFLRWPHAPSMEIGGALVERIRSLDVDVRCAEVEGDYLEGARGAVALARSLRPDLAVFVGSPACPIQAAMAWSRVAPVQLNQNIGSPLVIDGIDGVIYHNPETAEKDRSDLHRRGIRVHEVHGMCTDLEAADRACKADRRELGVPASAVLLVTAGNKIPARLNHGSFGADLSRFLRARTDAWWMAVGRGDFSPFMQGLEESVRRRVVLAGARDDIRPLLKAADIYLNEYPEGGCNTVLEAMACGLPVAAMHAGRAHTENIGAQLVGPEHAIDMDNRAAYWELVTRWCDDAPARRRAGEVLKARARQRFGDEALCTAYEAVYESALLHSTAGAKAGASALSPCSSS